MILGLLDMTIQKPTFTPPDPRFCTFEMQLVHLNYDNIAEPEVVKNIEMTPITKETHRPLYEDGGAISSFETAGLYVIKDPSEVTLINNFENA